MKKLLFSPFCIGVFLTLLLAGCHIQETSILSIQDNMFSDAEVQELQGESSNLRISVDQLQKWDAILRQLSQDQPLEREGDSYRLYAYLYYSQKMFADLSFYISNTYSGSLDLISFEIVKLFYPDYETKDLKGDAYTEALTALAMKTIRDRFFEEEKGLKPISIPMGKDQWKGKNPRGLTYPNLLPWAMSSSNEFQSPKPPPPNDPFWSNQLKQTQENTALATDEQKEISLFWERKIDPEAADWRYIAVEYMNKEDIPLEMQLEVRAKLMMTLIDALIAVFHDKYTYMVQRPFMRDPNTKTLFDTPNHPSYPAAHGTFAGAAETLLSYFFPENQEEWVRHAEECTRSRLWGGIHFPIDLEVGIKQGRQVAKAVIFRCPSSR